MKIILTFVLSAFAALMLITARAAVLPACPPQMMDEVMAMLADKTNDEKLAVLVSTLDEFLKGGGGYSRVFIDDATNAVVEEINGELLGETPDIFTPEYLEMLRATMLEDMVTDYIGKFNILDLAAKNGRNVEIRMNFGDRGTLTVATFSPEQVAEALHNYQPAQPPIEGDVVEGIDPLLVKLALILKDKGLNMNSAFGIFDSDNEGQISLDNFRSIASTNFKIENKDIDKLIKIIFGEKVVIDKQDFYQIFNNLLPFEDDADYIRKTKVLGEQSQISFNIIDKQNNNINNNINYNTTGALNQMDINVNNSGTMTNYNNLNNNLYSPNLNNNKYKNIRRNSRTMNEIILEINKYMFYIGKSTAADLFKIFDKDANLKVGKKELAEGFAKIGIQLNPEEHEMIWKSIVGTYSIEDFGFEEFKKFYEKQKKKKK